MYKIHNKNFDFVFFKLYEYHMINICDTASRKIFFYETAYKFKVFPHKI